MTVCAHYPSTVVHVEIGELLGLGGQPQTNMFLDQWETLSQRNKVERNTGGHLM